MGNGSTIRPGDVQRLSAGSGIMHSEFNYEKQGATHFLQIWLEPNVRGIAPSYEERHFGAADKRGRLRVVASPDGRDGSITIHQDALLLAGLFDGDETARHAIAADRLGYVHVARGHVDVNGEALEAGDALKTAGGDIVVSGGRGAEVLVFDLPTGAR
jgi:redox-sensitive bicupin YhaK (pirin superfamily)